MGMIKTFRSVVQFDSLTLDPVERRLKKVRIDRGLPADREAAAPVRRVRLHRRRRRGRAHARRATRATSPTLEFKPRVLRDVSNLDTSTTIFGRPASMPLILAPTGFTRIAHSQGELAVARAAAAGRHPVVAVDDGHPVDRGGRRGQRRREVVPGVHLEGPRSGAGSDRAGRRRPATRRCGSRSTPRCSAVASATSDGG